MAEQKMSLVEVRDHALWTKHIRGNDPLKAEITELSAGCRIELEVVVGLPHRLMARPSRPRLSTRTS